MIRRLLQFLLAALFLLSGLNKVTDLAHADTHQFLASEAPKWGKSTLSKASVDSATSDMLTLLILDDGSNTFKTFMSNIGYLEIFSAFLLLLDFYSSFGAILLVITMAGATYTHVELKDDKALVPGIFGALAFLLLILPSRAKPAKSKKQ